MKDLNLYTNYEEFLKDFSSFNEKAKYFKVLKSGDINILDPSYIFEIGYMYINKKFNEALELWNLDGIIVNKEKKIKRHSCLNINELEDKFFRALFNRDSVHILSLGNELIRRDNKKFFDILYLNSKISDDNNRLIKLYLFEKIYNDIGLNESILKNLLRYFTTSLEGYGNKKSIDELYSYIYEIKFGISLKINKTKKNKTNEIILKFLKGEN